MVNSKMFTRTSLRKTNYQYIPCLNLLDAFYKPQGQELDTIHLKIPFVPITFVSKALKFPLENTVTEKQSFTWHIFQQFK